MATLTPSSLLSGLFWLGEFATVAYVLYRVFLGFLSFKPAHRSPRGAGATRLLILVSAHDEQNVIAATVAALRALVYPPENRRIFVVADASTDATESTARDAGATVLAKPGPATGKGAVIQWFLARPEVREAEWDALVLFDADSRPVHDFLLIADAAVASGIDAIQGRSESAEQSGWVPRGYRLNTTQRNRIWHRAREVAGFSAALTGTGICFTRHLLDAHPPRTNTLTEDLEYTAVLALSGVRVHYYHDAQVRIEQPHNLRSSVRQRLRWARGQIRTALAYSPALTLRALRRLDMSAFDTALYLALPSVTPLQAGLFIWAAGDLLFPSFWPRAHLAGIGGLPPAALFVVLGLTILLSYLGFLVERRKAGWRDWLAFFCLMVSWLPIAIYAAMTTWVRSWHRTPHGAPALPAPRARPDEAAGK